LVGKYFGFNKKEVIHIDSLLPFYKKYLTGFNESYFNIRLLDPAERVSPQVQKIYTLLSSYNKSKSPSLDIIEADINRLPNSREKVLIILQFENFKIKKEPYTKSINLFYSLSR